MLRLTLRYVTFASEVTQVSKTGKQFCIICDTMHSRGGMDGT